MRIEHVTTGDGLRALAGEWNDLLARSAADSVFLSYEWVSTWWDVFGADFDLHLLVARSDEGELVGLAPLVVGRGPGRLMGRLPHLMLLGQQVETLAEHLDLIAADARAVEAMVAALDEIGWDVLLFERVPESSPTVAALATAERVATHGSPYVRLPDSFDALLASKSRNFRRQYNNSRNRLEREGEVVLRIAGEGLPFEEAFDELVRLHEARWRPGGSFETERYRAFHRAFGRAMLEKGALFLALLEVEGVAVAARYDFVHGGKAWCFQGGRDPAYEKMRPGTILTGRALEWAIGRGCTEYDFLSGGEGYKDRWADGERTLVDLRVLRDRPRVRWTRRLQRLKEWLKRG